ncbi:sulfatase-like hydrolase/transferase [Nitrospirota bacterium]
MRVYEMDNESHKDYDTDSRLPAIFTAACLLVYTVVGLEAAFLLSKSSFLSPLGKLETTALVLKCIGILICVVLVVSVFIKALSMIIEKLERNKSINRRMEDVLFFLLIQAFVLIGFVHLDIFLYTSINYNVAHLPFGFNFILLIFIVALGVMVYKKKRAAAYAVLSRYALVGAFLVMVSVGFLLASGFDTENNITVATPAISNTPEGLPDIIFFTMDGVDPSHMSLYGYERKTTPQLDNFARVSNVYTRAYSNCGDTRGSVASTLTGKSSFTTKVTYPPDVLKGSDAFEHLPGLLANLGYYNIHIGEGAFSTPRRMNMKFSFHKENGKLIDLSTLPMHLSDFIREYNIETFFLLEAIKRYTDRIYLMTGISDEMRSMQRVYKSLGMDVHSNLDFFVDKDDYSRIESLLEDISELKGPIFAHIHLVTTHGPRYYGMIPNFSEGKTQDKDMDDDFFDDSIATADAYLTHILKALNGNGRLKNSLVVVYTDHSRSGQTLSALPLLVHLPGQREGKIIDTPIQYLDLAPSVLSYIGVEVPQWMEGNAMFSKEDQLENKNRTFYMAKSETIHKEGVSTKAVGLPYHGIGDASVMRSGTMYNLKLHSEGKMLPQDRTLFDVGTDQYAPAVLDDQETADDLHMELISYLSEKGLDTSGLSLNTSGN